MSLAANLLPISFCAGGSLTCFDGDFAKAGEEGSIDVARG
jgi:hypothetical protein